MCALIAAMVARFDAINVLFVWHIIPFQHKCLLSATTISAATLYGIGTIPTAGGWVPGTRFTSHSGPRFNAVTLQSFHVRKSAGFPVLRRIKW